MVYCQTGSASVPVLLCNCFQCRGTLVSHLIPSQPPIPSRPPVAPRAAADSPVGLHLRGGQLPVPLQEGEGLRGCLAAGFKRLAVL